MSKKLTDDDLKALGALGPFSPKELCFMIADVAYNVGYNDAKGMKFQSDDPVECVIIQWLEQMFKDGWLETKTAKPPN
jgi:hypothetical protein